MNTYQDWQMNQVSIRDRFRELLLHSKWTDCSFRVGENNVEIIHAHKLVLAVSSPVFEALFYGSLASPEESIIDVPDIEPHIFKLFLSYIYSDIINLQSIDEAGGVLYMAKKYLLYELENLCISYLVNHTWLKTLWDVLAIAEVLNENELFRSCFKIMCRYSYDVWNSEEEHFNGTTLCRLLDETRMNMDELNLWQMTLDWAKKECKVKGAEETIENVRLLLEKIGALRKVRFLTLKDMELEVVAESGVLKEDEVMLLRKGDVPVGFSEESLPRLRLASQIWRCARDVILKNEMWIYRGEVFTQISSSSRVLITGFEVFTRVCTITDYMKQSCDYSYREKFVVFIKNGKDEILSKTDHDSYVEFNKTQMVSLSRPIWFEPEVKYTVQIGVLTGQYPLCTFRDSSSRGTAFEFKDVTHIHETSSVPSCGFIVTVLYSL